MNVSLFLLWIIYLGFGWSSPSNITANSTNTSPPLVKKNTTAVNGTVPSRKPDNTSTPLSNGNITKSNSSRSLPDSTSNSTVQLESATAPKRIFNRTKSTQDNTSSTVDIAPGPPMPVASVIRFTPSPSTSPLASIPSPTPVTVRPLAVSEDEDSSTPTGEDPVDDKVSQASFVEAPPSRPEPKEAQPPLSASPPSGQVQGDAPAQNASPKKDRPPLNDSSTPSLANSDSQDTPSNSSSSIQTSASDQQAQDQVASPPSSSSINFHLEDGTTVASPSKAAASQPPGDSPESSPSSSSAGSVLPPTGLSPEQSSSSSQEAAHSSSQSSPESGSNSSTSLTSDQGCPNNCSGIGICVDSICQCPFVDPHTGLTASTPPSSDCSKYGEEAFGSAWLPFRISWIIIFTTFALFLLIINLENARMNNWRLMVNLRHTTYVMINLAMILRALYYAIDPFSLHHVIGTVPNRILFSLFFPICLSSYIILLFHWIEICQSAMTLERRQARFSKVGAVTIVLLLLGFEAAVTIVQIHWDVYTTYFAVHYASYGAVLLITIPVYIYYGHMVIRRMKGVVNDRDGKVALLRRKILMLAYGPAGVILLMFAALMVDCLYLRQRPLLFLVGDSLCRFTEALGAGLFVFALLPAQESPSRMPGIIPIPKDQDGDRPLLASFHEKQGKFDSNSTRPFYGQRNPAYGGGYLYRPKSFEDDGPPIQIPTPAICRDTPSPSSLIMDAREANGALTPDRQTYQQYEHMTTVQEDEQHGDTIIESDLFVHDLHGLRI